MSASVHPPGAPPPPRPAASQYQGPSGRPPQQGSPSRTRLLLAVGTVAVLALAILVIAVVAGGHDGSKSSSAGPSVADAGPHAISAPLSGREKAQFEITSGAESISIRSDDLGEDLYRISTPKDGRLVPKAIVNADGVQLSLVSSGSTGAASAEVVLSTKVLWQLKLAGGGMKETINFGSGKLSGLELGAGAGDIDIALPKAQGLLAVRLTGGAGSLKVHLPQGPPVQVKVGGAGAGVVTIDGQVKNGVKAGTEITPTGWAKAADRYSIEAVVGVSTLTVDRK